MKRKDFIKSPQVAHLATELGVSVPTAIGLIECLNWVQASHDLEDYVPDSFNAVLSLTRHSGRKLFESFQKAGVIDTDGALVLVLEGEYSD